MNKELENLISTFREQISSLPLVKEFNTISKEFNESSEIKKLQEDLKKLQIQLTKLKAANKEEEYLQLKEKITNLKDKYFTNPLVNNYFTLKDEIEDLISQISFILNNL